MIFVSELFKSFGKVGILNGITFHVAPGQAVALWGPNGAGKSTALRCVLGLLRCRGSITIGGLDIHKAGRRARSLVGYVPQELSFYDDLRVFEAMRLFAAIRRVAKSQIATRLGEVGLTEHARKAIGDLSGGMKQKLAIAIARLADPPALLLDEPTSNLDSKSRREVLDALRVLRDEGKAILFTSHRSEEMERLANRILTIENGIIVARRDVGSGHPEGREQSEPVSSPAAADIARPAAGATAKTTERFGS